MDVLNIVIPFCFTFCWTRRRSKGVTEIEKLHDIQAFLTKPKLQMYFLNFCKKEFSLENPLFMQEVRAYKKIKNDEKRAKRAKDIFATFIESGALLELNIDSRQRSTVRAALDKAPLDIFDIVLAHVEVVINDTFSRFETSAQFKYLEQKARDKQDFYEEVGLADVKVKPPV